MQFKTHDKRPEQFSICTSPYGMSNKSEFWNITTWI